MKPRSLIPNLEIQFGEIRKSDLSSDPPITNHHSHCTTFIKIRFLFVKSLYAVRALDTLVDELDDEAVFLRQIQQHSVVPVIGRNT